MCIENLKKWLNGEYVSPIDFKESLTEVIQQVEGLEKAKTGLEREFMSEYSWQVTNVVGSPRSQWHKGALRGFEHSKEIYDRHFPVGNKRLI